jgi:hypothetical protein
MGLQPSEIRGPCAAGVDVRPGSWDIVIADLLKNPKSQLRVVRPVFVGKVEDEAQVLFVMRQYNTRFAVADSRAGEQRIAADDHGPVGKRAGGAGSVAGRSAAPADSAAGPGSRGVVLMELIVSPDGVVRCIYGEDLDLHALGSPQIRRVSAVEPDEAGRWWADLSPVNGPDGAFRPPR